MELFLDILAGICLIVGCLMSLGAAIGIVRFPDLLSRIHAGTKPQVFGLMMLLLGIGLHARQWTLWPLLLIALLLQLLTIPISAHMVGRSGYRNKHFRADDLVHDDLRKLIDEVEESEAGSVRK
ncbi:MAG: monovalent cation/H(+) antiporter subunit G [Rothia sp. (in: high G+C Gram-positive bacteria)]|nr:monovalent cation/H(+) antiporter subunit G [Rothia sp. (in: high G+C Gram-positive bacteria)]